MKEGASELGLRHDASVADVKQTNGIAEQYVRRVKERTSCLLLQYGLEYCYWPQAMEAYSAFDHVFLMMYTIPAR